MLLLGLALRLYALHNPILDHPGWRQGDTASIAKNFAVLRYNVLYPQTNYDGPPPDYVELELQIVPIVAATLYEIVGIHEIIGRLISIAFSLGSALVLALFGRWMFGLYGGLFAALFYLVMPGSIYYGRTFTPDTTMVFFLTAALYVITRMIVEDRPWSLARVAGAAALLSLAFLAKPVSLTALAPIAVLVIERLYRKRPLQWGALAVIVIVPLALLTGYDRAVASHAEWHWASGIMNRHVLPALGRSFQSGAALHVKLIFFRQVLRMLVQLMIGPALTAMAIVGFFVLPKTTRSRTLLWSWLVGGLAYAYVVVTVERVDYYLYLLLPLAALTASAFASRLTRAIMTQSGVVIRFAAAAAGLAVLAGIVYQNRSIVAPYYRYSKNVYRNAATLNAVLPKQALVVMGHYDPSILYYIGRYGWEEDPYLWTPFDQQSAIRKGARYFIAIEKNRFNRNVELCAWMQRFPTLRTQTSWTVYVTDPTLVKPAADRQWRRFREAEARGQARHWLDSNGLCTLATHVVEPNRRHTMAE